MPVPRFFAPAASDSGSIVQLPDDEAGHLTRVLRLGPGDVVRVFDGQGQEWMATVASTDNRAVSVRLGDLVAPAREARVRITLGMAVLKGDKMDDIIRDAVMLGVAAIQPLITTRTEISAAALERGRRVARWQRVAVASAKQCGRAVVPDVRPAARLDAVLAREELTVMLVEPAASVPALSVRDLPDTRHATLVVGPEGGWTDDEVDRARARGAMLLTLGGQTLRADAMPLVALTAVRVHWKDF